MTSSSRVLNVLLFVGSASFSLAVVFGGYILVQWTDIANLKAKLLAQNELQAELLNAQPLDFSVTPHLVDEIGFVLNPSMRHSTWKAHDGEPYPINSLGLRGPEIKEKEVGVTRILLVGDSMVFGWKLKEEDRLSSMLNRYVSDRLDTRTRVEFFAIALPGWNVRSETAFLESHLRLLDPDLIIWWSIPNDIEDVAGVVPPGRLASWASPHDKDRSPFAGLSSLNKRSGPVMPSIAKRMAENVALIASFQSKYAVPVVLLGLPGFFEYRADYAFNPPWIFIPREYRRDRRWRLSDADRHPSPWANHVIAMGVLSKLVRLGVIPEVEFAPVDKAIVQRFAEEYAEPLHLSQSERFNPFNRSQAERFTSWLKSIPEVYEIGDGGESNGVLYGIDRKGYLAKSGTLFWRDPGRSSELVLDLALTPNMARYPGAAQFWVRNRSNGKTHATVSLDTERIEIRLALPKAQGEVPVYEISWLFDYTYCTSPSNCSVAKLLGLGPDR